MVRLVPDYYPSFHCKAGACRSVCCSGWPVTFSMKDYFRLLSLDASPETKGRLDRALHLTDWPTEEEYAMLLPRYDGCCPMRREDGLCAIQLEAGEAALPSVCRLYPRGLRPNEASCANSCEAVIELLCRKTPLTFIRREAGETVKETTRVHHFETGGRETEIRMWFIGFVQDRRFALPQRLYRLGHAVRTMERALDARDGERIQALLSGQTPVEAPALAADLEAALRIIRVLLERLDALSDSIRDYGALALARFEREGATDRDRARARLTAICPHWEAWFENMIVNHMFFARFPFQDRPVSLRDEVAALYAVYALLRFLMIGAGDGTMEGLVDIAAALFRLVDHTAFDRYAVPILNELCGQSGFADLLAL